VFALPLDRIVVVGIGYEMPFREYFYHFNLNYFDMGDGETIYNGGPITGDVSGSFDRNFVIMFDIQVRCF